MHRLAVSVFDDLGVLPNRRADSPRKRNEAERLNWIRNCVI